ncbi:hypothetical protein ACXR0O_15485 [Verrucomicrobiota bacterium sgz303538]
MKPAAREARDARSTKAPGSKSTCCLMAISLVVSWMVSITAIILFATGVIGPISTAIILALCLATRWFLDAIVRCIDHAALELKKREQEEINSRCAEWFSEIQAGGLLQRPLFIYLRPFSHDAQYFINIGEIGSRGRYRSLINRRDMEGAIAKLTAPFGDFVALGNEEEVVVGAARIRIPDKVEWLPAVKTLCSAATLVFFQPAKSQGCKDEMELLRMNGLLSKTVFLMPPLVIEDMFPIVRLWLGNGIGPDKEYRMAASGRIEFVNLGADKYWELVRADYGPSVQLPPFDEKGLAFALGNNGSQVIPISSFFKRMRTFAELQDWTRSNPPGGELEKRLRRYSINADDIHRIVAEPSAHIQSLMLHILDFVDAFWKARQRALTKGISAPFEQQDDRVQQGPTDKIL